MATLPPSSATGRRRHQRPVRSAAAARRPPSSAQQMTQRRPQTAAAPSRHGEDDDDDALSAATATTQLTAATTAASAVDDRPAADTAIPATTTDDDDNADAERAASAEAGDDRTSNDGAVAGEVDVADLDIDALIESAEAVQLDDLETVLGASNDVLSDFTSLNLADAAFSEALVTEEPSRAQDYIEELQGDTEEQHISIGMLDLEQIAAEEARLHEEIEKYEQFREEKLTRKQKMLLEQVIVAKKELSHLVKTQKKKLRDAEQLYRRRRRRDMEALSRAFRRAEERLVHALKRRHGEIKTTYGSLTLTDGIYSGTRRRRWRIDWSQAPQPVQIMLACIRGLRDKCASGRLVLSVSMYDRLGGHLMRWSRLPGQEWCGNTLPFKHDARFFSIETDVNQSVFTVCPPEARIKPSMVFVFELFILKNDGTPFDRALAWGVFPMINSEFELVSGKFKVPMHRGDMDPSVITHAEIEKRLARDLDSWLCNLYFTVSRLPRYTSGQREYEVELQYTSSLLGHPERDVPAHVSPEDEMAKAVKHIHSRPTTAPQPAPPHGLNAKLRELSGIQEEAVEVEEEHLLQGEGDDGVQVFLKRAGPFEEYHRNVVRLSAERRKPSMTKKKTPTRLEALQEHTNSVAVLQCAHRRNDAKVEDKTAYVWREIGSEFSVYRIKTSTFWITVACLLLCFWARLYLHYAGQWVFLQALRVPVTEFTVRSFTVNLGYQPSLLLVREQLGVVAFGPIAVAILMVFFIAVAGLARYVFGRFPEIGYRFILAWCIMTVLDPLLILIVDLALERWKYDGVEPVGDAFKLYWHFDHSDDGGLPGIFITAFVYIVIMFASAMATYLYLLRLHLNAAILDLYRRLTATPDDTFVPYDNELSIQELDYLVRKAEQWRGQRGERRKVAVYDHVWTPDEQDAAAEVHPRTHEATERAHSARTGSGGSGGTDKGGDGKKRKKLLGGGRRMSAEEVVLAMQRQVGDEVTTHVSIHTINLDGTTTMYRQFLRLPDGAIVEVFGAVGGNLDQRVQKTLDEAHVDISTLTRESTRIIQDKFHSSAAPVATMTQRPSAFSLLSVSAFAMSQRRHTPSSTQRSAVISPSPLVPRQGSASNSSQPTDE
ncbi:hypothetical protein PTSG_05991 [Salpingoeca rosetta]|uniref:Uncharacterized protein n=1 Tax=Salpingoeca rosetta (strain ATCC 50818 / BSB-021) TaxID=946362 RepID=F2UDD2_SALR5|nr:uncharacterized protein PTSG_05991 [Salpingoeca rosetta]EGD74627.1 hypothetical protein PTSG_05991 [Salpingoeca rosetta]|eukprot:XP_004992884.1 hypothetical protein PTSG_05991 [Salpingoeca rosetta]